MIKKVAFATVSLLPFITAPVYAQASSASDQPQDADAIIVTGTREIGRTQFQTLSPVDVLAEDAIDNIVSDDIADILTRLLPSFNVQRLPAADGLAFVRPATLRGLSPDQTLVLVNGKRYHRSALLGTRGAQAPDLNTIPSLALRRIEVLRDGASAQYGSDAIAGVINVILDDQPGLDAYARYAEYYEGDGQSYQIGLQGGIALGDRGSLVFSSEFVDSAATSRTRQRPDAVALQLARPDLNIPDPVQRWGQPDLNTVRGAVNAIYELAEAAELYSFGILTDGEGVTDFNWRNPVNTSSVFRATRAFPGFNFTQIYPAGFTPRFGTAFEDVHLASGMRGAFGDGQFTYDLSIAYGRSRIDYNLQETLNASLGPLSPTSFYLGRLEQRELNLNADFVYRLAVGGAEPINMAFGAERRRETYVVAPGEPASFAIGPGAAEGLSPNANGFAGFGPLQIGTFDQTSYAGYVDVEWQPVSMLTIGAAGRYEDFSQFGDTFNYKLAARIEPVSGLAARATYSTGFRAPTPGQLNSSATVQGLDTRSLQVFNNGRVAPSDPLAIALGAQALRPEESENLTAGIVFQSDFGLTASIDVYQIDVTDRFGQSNAVPVPAGTPNPFRFGAVSFFTNDFDTRTRGIDVVAAYSRPVSFGSVDASIAYSYNETEVLSAPSASIATDTQRIIFEQRLPRHNAVAAIGLDSGPLRINLRGRYFGSWTDSSGNAIGDIFQRFGAIVLVDASASLRFADHFTLQAGAENLFNRFPDEATFQANRGLIYSRNAPYDTDGGLYYIRLGMEF